MNESSDEMLNLGKYLETLINQWQLIVGLTLVITLLAGLGLLATQDEKKYEARAYIASTRYTASVTFESAIKTLSDTEDRSLVDRKARMASYVLMVKNPEIAREVLDQMGDKLDGGTLNVTSLLEMIEGSIALNSDSIRIKATDTDPQVAADLANAWARAYVNQINAVYSDSGASASYSSIKEQTAASKKGYESAQAELEHFIANNQLDEYSRKIDQMKILINGLEFARNTAITTTIDEQTKAQVQIVEKYLDAQTQNRLLALQADQDGRRQLITRYISGMNEMRQKVFDEQVKHLQAELERAFGDKRTLEGLLKNTQDMRDQVQKGGAAAAASNTLAVNLLKVQVFSPNTVQTNLQIQTNPASAAPEAMLADLEGLIWVLQARQHAVDMEIQKLSDQLTQGQTLTNLDQALDPSGELAKAIQSRYPDLFGKSALSDLSLDTSQQSSPLFEEARSRTREFLEMKSLEDVASFDFSITPIEKKLLELELSLRDLQAALAREQDRQLELTRGRDLAWETYKTLATKEAERGVALQTKGSEVALAVPAAPPSEAVDPGFKKNIAIAFGAALVTSILLAFAIEFWWNYKGIPVKPVVNLPIARLRKKRTK